MILCWAVKGGSGTTVVAAAIALAIARTRHVTLVDLGGDAAVALGAADHAGPGVIEWMQSATAGPDALVRLAAPVSDTLRLLHRGADGAGGRAAADDARWGDLAAALTTGPAVAALGDVVVDCGTGEPPGALHDAATQSFLVSRPCFLALRRAGRARTTPTGVVLVREPGRALRTSDVEHALAAPVVVEIEIDPAVARAVDAGLLAARLPRSLAQSLRGVA